MSKVAIPRGDQRSHVPLNCLIVEDNGETCGGLRRATNGSPNGYRLFDASTECGALYRLGISLPDVVILDMATRALEGRATLEHVREVSSVPVIALSDEEDPQARIQFLELGADCCVPRDVTPGELLARARALVRRDRGSFASQRRENSSAA